MHRFMRLRTAIGSLGLVMLAGMCQPVLAANLCVNPRDPGDCYATISAAVTAAEPGDVIHVRRGTYTEDVTIAKPLSLIGENRESTVIDASGLPSTSINGITIVNASDVVISGFTVENAPAAGIKVTGSTAAPASHILISNNTVMDNDTAGEGNCATVEPLEPLDCGEGVFLSGVDHSVVANNTVTGNAGGILVTDDTGPNHDNLITGNSVVKNTGGDCGITLPSHTGMGVYHNTVSGNDSSYNSGPGVGMFAPGPGTMTYGNVIINNKMRGDQMAGIAMHNHATPGVNGVPGSLSPPIFNDNVIEGNDISDNTADTGDAATAGPVGINIFSVGPMTGTIIARNRITKEAYDIVINVPEPPSGSAPVQAHLNALEPHAVGIDDAGAGSVDATLNWWGCPSGPDAGACATASGSVLFSPWLRNPVQTNPGGELHHRSRR